MKYRKKLMIVEAFQITKRRGNDKTEWPNWLRVAWNRDPGGEGSVWSLSEGTNRIVIGTLEGAFTVAWDDWIIRGVMGELYACHPDIFKQTYEEYEEAKCLT